MYMLPTLRSIMHARTRNYTTGSTYYIQQVQTYEQVFATLPRYQQLLSIDPQLLHTPPGPSDTMLRYRVRNPSPLNRRQLEVGFETKREKKPRDPDAQSVGYGRVRRAR